VKYLLKSWLLAVKLLAHSLDYCANSYHIHLNTLAFHGYGKEISQKYPCSICPINTSFPGTLSSPCHPPFLDSSSGGSSDEELTSPCNKNSPKNPQVFDSFDFGKNMTINFIVPEVNPSPFLYYNLFSSCKSTYLAFSSFLFPLFFQSSNLRSWAKKLLFPLNNPISNASVHWVTQILPIWSMRKQTEFLLEPRFFLRFVEGYLPILAKLHHRRNKTPQTAYFPLLSTSPMMKAMKQALLRQSESHRQKSRPS